MQPTFTHTTHRHMHTSTCAHSYKSTFIMTPEEVNVWQCWHHCCRSAGHWLLFGDQSPSPQVSAPAPLWVEDLDGLWRGKNCQHMLTISANKYVSTIFPSQSFLTPSSPTGIPCRGWAWQKAQFSIFIISYFPIPILLHSSYIYELPLKERTSLIP